MSESQASHVPVTRADVFQALGDILVATGLVKYVPLAFTTNPNGEVKELKFSPRDLSFTVYQGGSPLQSFHYDGSDKGLDKALAYFNGL